MMPYPRIAGVILFAGLCLCIGAAAAETGATTLTTAHAAAVLPDIPGQGLASGDGISADADGGWETMAPLPAPRVFSAVTSCGEYVYVIGGTSDASGNNQTKSVFRYNTTSNSWITMAPLPDWMAYHDAVAIGQKIYVPGDYNTGTTYVYDIASDTWSSIAANHGYTGRMHYSAVPCGNEVVVIGGINWSVFEATTEVWRLNTGTGVWKRGVSFPDQRMNAAAASYGSQIAVTGGVNFPGFSPYLTTWVFDGTTWNAGTPVPDNSGTYNGWRFAADGQTTDGSLWIGAGQRDALWNVVGDTGVYYIGNDTWNATPDLPVLNQPRVYTSGTIAADGYFYVAGGRNPSATVIYASFERLNVTNVTSYVSSISPKAGKQGTTVKIRKLAGNYFGNGATVNLTKGAKKIRGTAITVVNPGLITCRFKIPGAAPTGKWTVNVTNPDGTSALLVKGFKVKA